MVIGNLGFMSLHPFAQLGIQMVCHQTFLSTYVHFLTIINHKAVSTWNIP